MIWYQKAQKNQNCIYYHIMTSIAPCCRYLSKGQQILQAIKNELDITAYTLEIVYSMSSISKRLSLRVPADIIYRALKDTRLEQLFLNSLLRLQGD
jgi:hypothetical protein